MKRRFDEKALHQHNDIQYHITQCNDAQKIISKETDTQQQKNFALRIKIPSITALSMMRLIPTTLSIMMLNIITRPIDIQHSV
jgi:hypothetical protein